jgi:hypothetical protein
MPGFEQCGPELHKLIEELNVYGQVVDSEAS